MIMSSLEAIISWRRYLRNRLHRLLQRAGWEILNTPISMGDRQEAPIELVQKLDKVHLNICNSIERYAFKLPEAEQRFRKIDYLPMDTGPVAFSEMFFKHYMMVTAFIESLKSQEWNSLLETKVSTAPVTVKWMVEYCCFYEQSIIDQLIMLIKVEHPEFHVPWAMSQYLRPVVSPDI